MAKSQDVKADWLEAMYLEAGLPEEVAGEAGRRTLERLLEGPSPPPTRRATGVGLIDALDGGPTQSVSRILESGLLGLPFHDPDSGRLSLTAFADVLIEAGEDPVPAVAFARVMVEMVEPDAFYGPIWHALGGRGPVDLERLAAQDWSIAGHEGD